MNRIDFKAKIETKVNQNSKKLENPAKSNKIRASWYKYDKR
jgi:hypothetical protein